MFSVKPEGLRFRQHIFPSLDRMIGWFKNHYNEVVSIYSFISLPKSIDLTNANDIFIAIADFVRFLGTHAYIFEGFSIYAYFSLWGT